MLGEGKFSEVVLPLPPGFLDGLIRISQWDPSSLRDVADRPPINVYMQVKIGERDITDIVDVRVQKKSSSLARQLVARNY